MNEFNEKAEVTRAHEVDGATMPFIDLGIGNEDDGDSVRLTPTEARQLAAELVRLADEIEGAA